VEAPPSVKKKVALFQPLTQPKYGPMPRDDPLYGRQTDPGAFKLGIQVQPLKWGKEFVCVGHVKSGPVISDEKYGLVPFVFLTNSDLCLRVFGGEFPGVSKQVFEDDGDQAFVAVCLESISDPDGDIA